GLAIVVHPSNPVSELSVDEISEIFSGGYTDWSQVGGRPGAIHVYARDENSGTWDSFKSMVLGNTPLIASAKRFESNAVLSDEVSAD
ncbi:substrate-binding domain-containing protein, partial [Wenyingzhuangia sp. 1_MG-2023]|nr:substrate-binding domain-containing protein [Wenyingzhuangia sp. 1_MG-2023]